VWHWHVFNLRTIVALISFEKDEVMHKTFAYQKLINKLVFNETIFKILL